MATVEADFCAGGLRATAAAVVEGLRGPDVLFGRLHCVCQNAGPHSEQCVRLFHHQTVRMPADLAVAALDRCYRERHRLPGFANALLSCLVAAEGAMAVTGRSEWRKHPVAAAAAAHRLAKNSLRAHELRTSIGHLPRRLVLRARPRVVSATDAAAAASLGAYQRWLASGTAPNTALRDAWAHEVMATAKRALAGAGLPAELVALVMAHVRL